MKFDSAIVSISVCFIFYFAFFAIFLCDIKVEKKKEMVALTKTESLFLKGMAILMVMLSHFQDFMEINNFELSMFLKPFSFMGGMGVLIFFFLSGYGICKAYSDKEPTLNYWRNRIGNIFVPAIIISTISCLIIDCVGETIDIKNFIIDIFTCQWYIDVLMIECMVFFVAWVIAKSNKKFLITLVFAGSVIVAITFYMLNFNSRWYNGVLLFPMGTLIAYIEKKLMLWCNKKKIGVMTLAFIIFLLTGILFTKLKGNLLGDCVKTISGGCLSIVAVLITSFVKVGNKYALWMGKRSLYIYLCHLYLLQFASELINKKTAFVNIEKMFYLILLGSFVYAEIMYLIFGKRKGIIK